MSNQPTANPATITRLGYAVDSSFAMYAGMKLDVFSPLNDGPMTVEQVAEAIKVKPTRLRSLLYALVNAELLTVQDGLFSNTPEANSFLVKGLSSYMGGMHEMLTEMWNAELKLAESISTDTPRAKIEFSSMSTEELEPNLRGLHSGALASGRQIALLHDFSSNKTLVDIGGGTGGLAIAVVEAFPHIRATVVELPNIEPITVKCIDEAGLSDQIGVLPTNVIEMPPPGMYDVAPLRCVLQIFSPEECQSILHNVSKCLNPGGSIYIVGQILDDSRLSPASAVGTNMFFASAFDGGQSYTHQEHKDWLIDAGFEDICVDSVEGEFALVNARKHAS